MTTMIRLDHGFGHWRTKDRPPIMWLDVDVNKQIMAIKSALKSIQVVGLHDKLGLITWAEKNEDEIKEFEIRKA